MKWFLKVIKQYADFDGRARRMEYWMYALIAFIIGLVIGFIEMLLGFYDNGASFGVLSLLYNLFLLIPGIAVSVRRLHDLGKSGWWLLIAFIPIVGLIWLLVLFFTEGESGSNEYGPDPKVEAVVGNEMV